MREELDDWKNSAKFVEEPPHDEVHCGCVPVLRKLLKDARAERDQWREAAEGLAQVVDYLAPALRSASLFGTFSKERAALAAFDKLKEASK